MRMSRSDDILICQVFLANLSSHHFTVLLFKDREQRTSKKEIYIPKLEKLKKPKISLQQQGTSPQVVQDDPVVQKVTFSLNSADRTYFVSVFMVKCYVHFASISQEDECFYLKNKLNSNRLPVYLFLVPTRKQPMRQRAHNKQQHWHFSPMASPFRRD